MKPIPFASPHAEYLLLKDEIDAAIKHTLDSGWYVLGPEVEAFEREFASYTKAKCCIGVASGTDALLLGLRALGIGAEDEVITTAHTAIATIAAIELSGAKPILADINLIDRCIDVSSVRSLVSDKTKAILPVHIFGQPANMCELIELAKEYSLQILEDCAQATGAFFQNQHVGNIGELGAHSFYPTKNLGALGDGGAITTNSKEIYDKLLLLRQYGWKVKQRSEMFGCYNSRLDEIQAAVLRVKLRHLSQFIRRRQYIAQRYIEHCEQGLITPPKFCNDRSHSFHLFVVEAENPASLESHLKQRGIGTAKHYPFAVHQQPAYQKLRKGSLENTEKLYKRMLSIPISATLSDEEVDRICEGLESWKPENA